MTALPIAETDRARSPPSPPTILPSPTGRFTSTPRFCPRRAARHRHHRSVSRIGGKAQHEAIKREAGRMKLDYLQFSARCSRFGASSKPRCKRHPPRTACCAASSARTASTRTGRSTSSPGWIACNESLLDDPKTMRSPRHCSACAKEPPPPTSFSTARATSGSRRSRLVCQSGARARTQTRIRASAANFRNSQRQLPTSASCWRDEEPGPRREPSHRHLHRRPTRRRPHRRGHLAEFIADYAEHIVPAEASGEVLCIVGWNAASAATSTNASSARASAHRPHDGQRHRHGHTGPARRWSAAASPTPGAATPPRPWQAQASWTEVQNILADLVATLTR